MSLKQESSNVRTDRGSDVKREMAAFDSTEEAGLQTGSTDSGSRNPPKIADNASGEVLPRSADRASNSAEVRAGDDDGRSREDRRPPTDGAVVEEPEVNWNDDSDERKLVLRVERSEPVVNARCASVQRCSRQQAAGDFSATGHDLTSVEAVNEADESWSMSEGVRADVKLERHVNETQLSQDHEVDTDSLKPSITTSSDSRNHVVSACSANERWSLGATENNDVTSAKLAGALVDRISTKICIGLHFAVTYIVIFIHADGSGGVRFSAAFCLSVCLFFIRYLKNCCS